MKKYLSFVLTLILLCGLTNSVCAQDNTKTDMYASSESSIYMSATEKQAFAYEMNRVYQQASEKQEIKLGTKEEKDQLIATAVMATGEKQEQLFRELEKYGVYVYNVSDYINSETQEMRSDNSDVTVNRPTILYNSSNGTWVVTCGGTWKNNNWMEQLLVGDIGDKDGWGVGFTNTSGTYSTYVVEATAYIKDQNNSRTVTTTNRSDGNGKKGFGFQLQDYAYNTYGAGQTMYVGYQWYGQCVYDANFASYSGVATGYYVHTYKDTSIKSISFGVNGQTAGVTVTLSGDKKGFTAYGSDISFE